MFHATAVAWCASITLQARPKTVTLHGETMTLEAAWAPHAALATETPAQAEPFENTPVIVEPDSVQVGDKRFHPETTSAAERSARIVPAEARPRLARVEPVRQTTAVRPRLAHQPPHRRPQPVVQASPASIPKRIGEMSPATVPEFVFSPPAIYPRNAVLESLEGTVRLRVTIDVDGHVTAVRVERSSGHAILDGAAVNAVRRWRTRPLLSVGRDRPLTVIIPLQFRIPDRAP